MKVVLEVLILKCILGIALASPKDRIQKFPDSSSEEKVGDYNIKDILKKTQDDKNFDFYQHTIQEHTLKANDRRRDYVRCYLKKPLKSDENYSSDSSNSFDSSAEISESLESELNNDNNNSEKNKHWHRKVENSNSDSSKESESRSQEKNVDKEDKEENSKIKSLLKKLTKSFHNKNTPSVKGIGEVNIEHIFRESTITKWREIEIIVKLLLIDNYKYTKKVLHMEIFNNRQSSQNQISRLERQILQEYYLSKKDISQMVKLAKKKFKKDVSKLSKKKTHEVEQLYFSQLKDQINEKVVVFKQNIKSAIDQFQLESKPTLGNTVAEHSKTTDIQNVSSIKQPPDSIYRNERIINHDIDLPPVVSIICAVNITTDDIPNRLWTDNNKNNNDSDGAAVFNQGFDKKPNQKTTSSGTQSSTNTQKSSNSGQVNDNTNEIINEENKLTNSRTDAENSSFKNDDLSNKDVTSKIVNPAISASDVFLEPLQENGVNQLHADATVKNEQDTRYFSQELSARFLPSNVIKNNGKDNQVGNNSDIDIGLVQRKPSSTVNDELAKSKSQPSISVYSYVFIRQHPRITADIGSQTNKPSFQISDGKFENGIVPLNSKTTVEINGYHNASISDKVVTDYMKIRHENLTYINKIRTVTETEINVNPPLNLTETAVNDKKLKSPDLINDFSNVDNKTTQTKNISNSNHVTATADSDNFNETDQVKSTGTLTTNNKSISEALSDSNIKNNSLSIDQHKETARNDSIVEDDQMNSTINTNLIGSTTTKVIDFIYSTEQPVSINKLGYPRENKTKSNIIIQKNETVEVTNIDTRSQYVNDLILTETRTNFNTAKESMGNSNYKNNTHISRNDGISNNEIVNDTQNSNDAQIEQNINIISTNFTAIKINNSESRQPSKNNQIIINHLLGNEDVTLYNNQSESQKIKNYEKPNERNIISTQSLVPTENDYTNSNTTSDNVNGAYDYPKSKSIVDVTNDNNALNNNKSIKNTDSHHRFNDTTENLSTNYYSANPNNNSTAEYPHTTEHSNKISLSTIMYNLESSSNFDGQNQKHAILMNTTENVRNENQSLEPIDGNIENLSGRRNVDLIPHDVNAENVQNASDTNEGVKIVSTKSNSINTTNDYGAGKLIDDNNSLIKNSFTAPIVQTTFELQNIKDINNTKNSGKERDVNGPVNENITTPLHLNSTTPPNNIREENITQYTTTNIFEPANTTDNQLNNKLETTVVINSYSTNKSSDYLLTDYNTTSTFSENAKIISTDIPVTETNVDENLTRKSSDSIILEQHLDKNNSFNEPFEPLAEQSTKTTEIDKGTAKDNNHAIGNQSEKTIQIDLVGSDNHYNESPIPHSATTIKKPENEIIFNNPAKIIPNKTSTIDSSSYGNEEIATNSTKVSDSGYFSIDPASNVDNTTNKDFYTGLEVETVTKNESKIINTSISTPQIDSEPTQSTVASIVASDKIVTDITTEGAIMITTIIPVNKTNTNECKDGKGTIIDCESLILSANIKNTNTNIENKKSTVNVWPGIPHECLPLFLASDGTVLREIPSIVNITDAQTRNLCVSIAITIIQLNSLPSLL